MLEKLLTVVVKPVNDSFEAVVLYDHVVDAVVSADDIFSSLNHYKRVR